MPESQWLSAEVECAVRTTVRKTGWAYGVRIPAEDVDDFTQESLIRLIQKAPATRSPKAYAAQVARNVVISALRKRFAARRDERKTTTLAVAERSLGKRAQSLNRLLAREEIERVLGKWRELLTSKRFRAMYLTHVAGLSSIDAGNVMGISRDAVDSLVYKARQRLGNDHSGLRRC